MAKILISTSSMTEANVADLRVIHERLQELTERAERILQRANEVFPAARSGWLRKLKGALGLLALKDGATLEDTIRLCERLVSQPSYSATQVSDYPVHDIAKWLEDYNYYLVKGNKRISAQQVQPALNFLNVRSKATGKTNLGTLNYHSGQWVFVQADLQPTKQDLSTLDTTL